MRQISVAVAQMMPKLNAMEDNLQHMSEMIASICKGQKVDLIVFPELATSGYECGLNFTDLAQTTPGMAVNVIAQRASDIDMVYLTGYGFPLFRGGPMHYADEVGLFNVARAMRRLARNPHGDPAFWKPAPLLAKLAAEGKSFS